MVGKNIIRELPPKIASKHQLAVELAVAAANLASDAFSEAIELAEGISDDPNDPYKNMVPSFQSEFLAILDLDDCLSGIRDISKYENHTRPEISAFVIKQLDS